MKKRDKNWSSRGQVTIFIILALIIVVVIAILFLLFRQIKPESIISDIENPQQYIQSCVKDGLKEGLEIIMDNGGYINQKNTVMWNSKKISGKKILPEAVTPMEDMIRTLAESLSEEQLSRIMPTLKPEQQLARGLF